ncbi:MAG: hypothetical protein ACRDK4_09065 [Solirubrobacteraceae bacterium]
MSVRVCAVEAGAVESVCRHHCLYPKRLRAAPDVPDVLEVRGGAERLAALLDGKVAAVAATPAPDEYGKHVAQALTRDLLAGGVTVAGLRGGLGSEACALVHEAGGNTLLIGACEVVESHEPERSLGEAASEQALASLADLVIVLAGGKKALDVLDGVGRRRRRRKPQSEPRERPSMSEPAPVAVALAPPDLQPELAAVLKRVASGEDTLAKLCAGRPTCGELTLALTELELLGLLRRGEDGRYLPP